MMQRLRELKVVKNISLYLLRSSILPYCRTLGHDAEGESCVSVVLSASYALGTSSSSIMASDQRPGKDNSFEKVQECRLWKGSDAAFKKCKGPENHADAQELADCGKDCNQAQEWEEYHDDNGRPYFFHIPSGTSVWERPLCWRLEPPPTNEHDIHRSSQGRVGTSSLQTRRVSFQDLLPRCKAGAHEQIEEEHTAWKEALFSVRKSSVSSFRPIPLRIVPFSAGDKGETTCEATTTQHSYDACHIQDVHAKKPRSLSSDIRTLEQELHDLKTHGHFPDGSDSNPIEMSAPDVYVYQDPFEFPVPLQSYKSIDLGALAAETWTSETSTWSIPLQLTGSGYTQCEVENKGTSISLPLVLPIPPLDMNTAIKGDASIECSGRQRSSSGSASPRVLQTKPVSLSSNASTRCYSPPPPFFSPPLPSTIDSFPPPPLPPPPPPRPLPSQLPPVKKDVALGEPRRKSILKCSGNGDNGVEKCLNVDDGVASDSRAEHSLNASGVRRKSLVESSGNVIKVLYFLLPLLCYFLQLH
jgi:hypothetical protein